MRRFLLHNRWAAVLVASLLLFATSGLSISRMTCLFSGHTVLSFGQLDDCCPDEQGGGQATFKATCCAFTQATSDRVVLIHANPLDIVPFFMVSDVVPFLTMAVAATLPHRWLDGRPPPLSAPDRLAVLGTYLI